MDLFTVSFFGHRIVPKFWEVEERVESLIHTLLLEKRICGVLGRPQWGL